VERAVDPSAPSMLDAFRADDDVLGLHLSCTKLLQEIQAHCAEQSLDDVYSRKRVEGLKLVVVGLLRKGEDGGGEGELMAWAVERMKGVVRGG
jgi:hypothetical protein